MGNASRFRMHTETFRLPSLLGCITLVAAEAATVAVVAGAPKMINAPASERAAISVVPGDESAHLHPYTHSSVGVEQSLGGVESSVISRGQMQRQISQRLAATAGLAVAAFSAIAFVVLQCVRKVLFPGLFGSMGKRALSNSDSEEEPLSHCAEEEEEGEQAGDAEGTQEEIASGETGESMALQALEDLKSSMALGMGMMPHLPANQKGILLVLTLTICTQELALYGFHSNANLELERQRTSNFILQEGERFLMQMNAEKTKTNAIARGKKMLRLLEKIRNPPPESKSEELPVEASISAYRTSQIRKALETLQQCIEKSTPTLEVITERALKIVSYTRKVGRRRLETDTNVSSWVETVQIEVGYFGILERYFRRKRHVSHLPFEEEMKILKQRYKRLSRSLSHSIEVALGRAPVEQHIQEQRQQQEHGLQTVRQQQHRSISQLPESTALPCSVLLPAEQAATLSTGVGLQHLYHSQPLDEPFKQIFPMQMFFLLAPALPELSQPPPNDLHQHTPTDNPERREQASPCSFPCSHNRQQGANERHSSLERVEPWSVLRPDAPEFTPRVYQETKVQQHLNSTSSDGTTKEKPLPPPPAFTSPWRPTDQSTAAQSHLLLAQQQHVNTSHRTGRLQTMSPVSTSAPGSRAPPPLPGPSLTGWRLPAPTEGLPLRFPKPALQNPNSDIRLRVFSGGQQQRDGARFSAPAPFWPPEVGDSHGDTYAHSLDPIKHLIDEAFPDESEQSQQGGMGWPRLPPSQSHSSSGDSSVAGERSTPVLRRVQDVPPASEGTQQKQEGEAWSIRQDSKDGSTQ